MDNGAVIGGNGRPDYGAMTANLVAAYVSHNRVATSEMPALITAVAAAFTGLQTSDQSVVSGSRRVTSAQIQASIRHEALISFEDDKPYKTIKRHLRACGLTPETYRAKWGLPSDYPMVAPAYGAERSKIAKSVAMGRYRIVR
ncbi:MucR family transcriptional regulator [Methylobacterium sp. B1]|uniref:MucR family transcriptional regulator n=1 Tax=Methylobacterium sp. B1 TaxID=91459 RepID=UPI0020748CB8|nr:MucR family transcriptional regulator [Methylobacterium sp. B1]